MNSGLLLSWATWILADKFLLGQVEDSGRLLLAMVAIVVSTILVFATKITHDNVNDVRDLKEDMVKNADNLKKIQQRIQRQVEIITNSLKAQRKSNKHMNDEQRLHFLGSFYLLDLYRDPEKIQSPNDLALDTLIMREEFRDILAQQNWDYIAHLANNFQDVRPELQQAVRADAAQLRAMGKG